MAAAADIPPDEVHVWHTDTAGPLSPEIEQRYWNVLSDEERSRQQRYRQAKHRQQFLVSHALVRSMLAHFGGVPPELWQFQSNAYGRPEIAAPEITRRLRFNLSHTEAMAVCAVAQDVDVGVDVEFLQRDAPGVELANRYFSPREVADLQRRPPSERQRFFFDYWTLKEAYIKARGMGLAIPLDQFSFLLCASDDISIEFDPRLNDQPADWQFAQHAPSPDHLISLAIRRGRLPPRRVIFRQVTPLAPIGAIDEPPVCN